MSYREPDEIMQLRARCDVIEARVQALEAPQSTGRLEFDEPRPEERTSHRVAAWWAEWGWAVISLVVGAGIIAGASLMVRSCVADTRERCERICELHGMRSEWQENATCGPGCRPTECVCSSTGLDGGVLHRFGAARGEERAR